jgi:hypothetical protein
MKKRIFLIDILINFFFMTIDLEGEKGKKKKSKFKGEMWTVEKYKEKKIKSVHSYHMET